ncbi:MAG: hypothetical protein ACLT4P_02920 [Coprococcus sp.]
MNLVYGVVEEHIHAFGLLDTPNDIVYLYRLTQDSPLLYAELACKPNGLQEYADAMNEFN